MEGENEFEDDNITVNKKYTFFVIDGSEAMFEAKKGEECDFKSALKLLMSEMLSICCQKSLNNQIGIIITNTESSTDEGLNNCVSMMRMGVPGQEEVNEIKGLLEEDDIKKAFEKYSNGYKVTDLSTVFNFCKRQFKSFSNTRHQSVIYLTNDRNPFGRSDFWESSYFKRTKTVVSKIIGHGHRKTLGEFSVILVPEDSYKPEDPEERNKEPWFHLDTEVFSKECDSQRRIRQKTTATRSDANVTLNLGPGVSFDVGVYTLVAEAQPLKSTQKFSKSTEMPIQNRVGYIRVDNPSSSSSNRKAGVPDDNQAAASEIGDIFSGKNVPDGYSSPPSEPTLAEIKETLLEQVIRGETMKKKNELKVSVTLGGEKVIITKEEQNAASSFDGKGIDLIGFCDQDAIDTELSVVKPKFLRPNEETTLGSTRIYRALLDRCFERKQAMICRYQTRSNEKLRMVALIPFKKESIGDLKGDLKPSLKALEKVRAQADASEFLHEGFHVISLPFKEEMRNDANRFSDGPPSGWPTVEEQEKEVAKKFIRKLTMSYNPSFYENPRLLSQKAALCERATGEELIERRDTLAPYHTFPERLARVQTEIDNLSEAFSLGELAKHDVKPAAKKRKTQKDDVLDDDEAPNKKNKAGLGTLRQMYDSNKLGKLTKDDLLELIDQYCKDTNAKKSMKKQELLDILNDYVENNL